jgi:serine/threonine protein kinase
MEQFGDYVLEEVIGQGGMAITYKARERLGNSGERWVALKKILPEHSEREDFRQMFEDESRVAALISHRAVCPVYRAGEIDGSLFIAMELVEGWALAAIEEELSRQQLRIPVEHALFIGSELLWGLQAAHALTSIDGTPLHVVHRDVSPQNVLISKRGEVKIIDFGIARAVGRKHLTQTGGVKGKLMYLSPEQIAGGELDARCDVFAAGVLLYELLTGKHPFEANNSTAVLLAITQSPPAAPSTVAAELLFVDQIINKALQSDPSQRWATAAEMATALDQALANLHPGYSIRHFARFTESFHRDGLTLAVMQTADGTSPERTAPSLVSKLVAAPSPSSPSTPLSPRIMGQSGAQSGVGHALTEPGETPSLGTLPSREALVPQPSAPAAGVGRSRGLVFGLFFLGFAVLVAAGAISLVAYLSLGRSEPGAEEASVTAKRGSATVSVDGVEAVAGERPATAPEVALAPLDEPDAEPSPAAPLPDAEPADPVDALAQDEPPMQLPNASNVLPADPTQMLNAPHLLDLSTKGGADPLDEPLDDEPLDVAIPNRADEHLLTSLALTGRCLFGSWAASRRSWERYQSWQTKAKPNCKEPLITYGIYEIAEHYVEQCQEAADNAAFDAPKMNRQAGKVATLMAECVPLSSAANQYYEYQQYDEDGCARGVELHDALSSKLPLMIQISEQLMNDAQALTAEVEDRWMAQLGQGTRADFERHLRLTLRGYHGLRAGGVDTLAGKVAEPEALTAAALELRKQAGALQSFVQEQGMKLGSSEQELVDQLAECALEAKLLSALAAKGSGLKKTDFIKYISACGWTLELHARFVNLSAPLVVFPI